MKIDCTSCAMYQTSHCEDCLVTALLRPPAALVDIDEDLEPPLGALGEAGLLPVLKFRPRDDDSRSEGSVGPRPQGQAGPPGGQASAASG
jgi:hypothetical protein